MPNTKVLPKNDVEEARPWNIRRAFRSVNPAVVTGGVVAYSPRAA